MRFLEGPGWDRQLILFAFILAAACAPEQRGTPPPLNVPRAEDTAVGASSITPARTVSKDCSRGDYAGQIESGGQSRQFLLHVPAAYRPEEPAALVLAFHGAGIGAERFVNYSGFSTVADREGFLIVYPQALGDHPTWNTTPGPNNPDIQFVSDLIEHLEERCNIDSGRIYASGHSNGGGMANRLACELADWIAAIGSVSGAYQWSEECSPARPVAIFAIHGTEDPIIPYSGYPEAKEPPAAYYAISVPIPQWAASWAERNECDSPPAEIAHNVLISEQRWSNCRTGADVILYAIEGGGHEWPADLINVAQTFWEFFKQHPLNPASQ